MKKFLIAIIVLALSCETVSAQMSDTLGALLIDGELSTQGYQALGQGQQAVNRMRFQQDLGNLVAEVQTAYLGNYAGLSKAGLDFNGFVGINWDIASAAPVMLKSTAAAAVSRAETKLNCFFSKFQQFIAG